MQRFFLLLGFDSIELDVLECIKSVVLDSIESGGEGEECYIPVDGDLVGCVTGLVVEVTLVRGNVLRVLHAIGLCILPHGVGAAYQEPGVCAFRMAVGEAVVRMRCVFLAETCNIAVARGVLAEDVVETLLGCNAVLLLAGQTEGIQALDASPATTLGVATPEEVRLTVAVRRMMHG